jgi:hypothetical protein
MGAYFSPRIYSYLPSSPLPATCTSPGDETKCLSRETFYQILRKTNFNIFKFVAIFVHWRKQFFAFKRISRICENEIFALILHILWLFYNFFRFYITSTTARKKQLRCSCIPTSQIWFFQCEAYHCHPLHYEQCYLSVRLKYV